MKTRVELNQKHGYGYQARMIVGGLESMIDKEPLMLGDIMAGTQMAIEEINARTGSNYKLHEVIEIDAEALEINAKKDFASALMLKEKRKEEAEGEILFTGRGVVKSTYLTWVDENNSIARESFRRYCQYLAMHGFGCRASSIFKEVEQMSKDDVCKWIDDTYDQYINDSRLMLDFILCCT